MNELMHISVEIAGTALLADRRRRGLPRFIFQCTVVYSLRVAYRRS